MGTVRTANLLAALDGMHPPMPKGKEHLVYRDFPKLPEKVWLWIKDVLTDYELHILSEAKYRGTQGMLMRGQIWVHPNGLIAMAQRFEKEGHNLFNTPPERKEDA